MNTPFLSRRRWIGSALASCASIAAAGFSGAETVAVPEMIELSTRHKFALWSALGSIHRGWARSAW
jgi:hypothetical protein